MPKKNLEERSGNVYSVANIEYEAGNFHIEGDSVAFIDNKVKMIKTIALRDITIIKSTNHSAGAWQGALIGAGAALGFSVVEIVFPPERKKNSEGNASIGAYAVVIGGLSIFGGLLGVLGDGIIGSHETYVFKDNLQGLEGK
jgi:hypothetical protein